MGRIKTWDELTICDNFLFLKVMQNKRICKKLIEKILGIRILRISYPVTEKSIDIRYDSKSVRLDVFVEDNAGTLYDIEMQTSDGDTPDELPKRARYYQAMMDMDVLNKSEYYTKLRKSFVIFICTFDPFGAGKSIYTFRETCQEDPSLLMGDETTKIFLNSQGNRDGLDPDITAFLDYVNGQAAKGRFAKSIEKEVQKVREHKETRWEYMTLAMELKKQRNEGHAEGRAEGRAEGEACFADLMAALFNDGRAEDAKRAASDVAYRNALFHEYHMDGRS
ncbi:Rpn family recombination-promoting nuclease/putative transposase [Selenomonas sp.]|uniref:Rpn family recombination-promoting nuclease/putative transposase n=1 Tax=Selenomonas sp. TaxID=2053611 RepID=UPI002A7F7271|nr:Rpn family recombination-promoting nuclease/putative transposase [Selenomonas sp.]MDY4415844.1 Rpn family recombination-promoting nuclease/putative transposase [Selenomonas sp.]